MQGLGLIHRRRWQATYQRALQQLVFVAALSEFLRSQQLVELPTIGSLLQIDPSSTRLTLQPEESVLCSAPVKSSTADRLSATCTA